MRRAGVDPAPSRFAFPIRHHHTMPTSPHRSRDAAWRALRDPELTASRHLRPSRTHRSTRKVQSSKSRCVERPLPSFPASARARSPPLRDATFATSTDFRRGIRRTSRGASRDATDAHLDAFAFRNDASRDGPRRPRPRGGTYASSAPGPHATGARTLGIGEQNDKGIFSEARLSAFGFATRTSEDALEERVTDLQTPFISVRPLL